MKGRATSLVTPVLPHSEKMQLPFMGKEGNHETIEAMLAVLVVAMHALSPHSSA